MFIGVDTGHTTVRAQAFDRDWNTVGAAGTEGGMETPEKGWFEIPIEKRWEVVLDCLDELESQLRPYDRIDGIGLAGAGGGLYLLDEDKEPIRSGITLLDERARDIYDRWKTDGTYQRICQRTGTPSPPGAALLSLRWVKDNDRDAYERTEHILNHKDAVRYHLTGDLAMELTDATFSFTNHRTQIFDDELFELAGVSDKRECLPELLDASYEVAGHVTGDVAERTGIPEGIPVVAGAHDACANTLGVGAMEENVVMTTGGTWSFSTMVDTKPDVQLDRWCCENFVERGRWMYQIANPTGTLTSDWFVDEFCEPEQRKASDEGVEVWDIIEEKIADIETEVMFHPFLAGNPYGYIYDQNASGSFTGISQSNSREDFIRAVYETIAFMHRWQVELFEQAVDIEEVRFTGGAAKSEFWAQMFADVLDTPVSTTTVDESGCFGAAMLAAIGTDHLSGVSKTPKLVEVDEVYRPTDTSYDQRYRQFKNLTDSLETVWEELA
jgi:L-xylulokinase